MFALTPKVGPSHRPPGPHAAVRLCFSAVHHGWPTCGCAVGTADPGGPEPALLSPAAVGLHRISAHTSRLGDTCVPVSLSPKAGKQQPGGGGVRGAVGAQLCHRRWSLWICHVDVHICHLGPTHRRWGVANTAVLSALGHVVGCPHRVPVFPLDPEEPLPPHFPLSPCRSPLAAVPSLHSAGPRGDKLAPLPAGRQPVRLTCWRWTHLPVKPGCSFATAPAAEGGQTGCSREEALDATSASSSAVTCACVHHRVWLTAPGGPARSRHVARGTRGGSAALPLGPVMPRTPPETLTTTPPQPNSVPSRGSPRLGADGFFDLRIETKP